MAARAIGGGVSLSCEKTGSDIAVMSAPVSIVKVTGVSLV